jgi:glycosyltransferase involved in cell wall biosynthesis
VATTKILMLPSDYLPHSVGGREIFTRGLTKELVAKGHDVQVAFHVCYGRPSPGTYEHDGVTVHALPAVPEPDRVEVYSCRPKATPGYEELLDSFRPDIVHLHDFGFSVSLSHIEAAKRRGAKIVMTYHSPGQSCLQRSLLFQGKTPCDGEILEKRCTSCRLEANGAPRILARLTSEVDLGAIAGPIPGAAGRILSARAMTRAFQSAWDDMVASVDVFHVYADWVRKLAIANGVAESAILTTSTGVPGRGPSARNDAGWRDGTDERRLRVLYMGRITKVKGVDVLVRAIKALAPEVAVKTLITGGGSPDQDTFLNELKGVAAGDPRIHFAGPLDHHSLMGVAAAADVCVVPSIWLETGPLTLLEAWSAGTPVLGSRLGGIQELVETHGGGILFSPGDHQGLAGILTELATKPDSLRALRATVPQPPTMKMVADEIEAAYLALSGLRTGRRPDLTAGVMPS